MDPKRAWLYELLAQRHLYLEQVALVRSLAEELGVPVVIADKRLSWNGGDWQVRQEDQDGR